MKMYINGTMMKIFLFSCLQVQSQNTGQNSGFLLLVFYENKFLISRNEAVTIGKNVMEKDYKIRAYVSFRINL